MIDKKLINDKGGKIIGYRRVSTYEQNLSRQLEGIELHKTFDDKISGSKKDRPGLNALLSYVRENDMIIVHSVDRLARNVQHLLELIELAIEKKVTFYFINGNITLGRDSSSSTIFTIQLLGVFSEFEKNTIKERQREGIEMAKKRGHYKGSSLALSREDIENLKEQYLKRVPVSDLAKHFALSRNTIYRYLKAEKVYRKDLRSLKKNGSENN